MRSRSTVWNFIFVLGVVAVVMQFQQQRAPSVEQTPTATVEAAAKPDKGSRQEAWDKTRRFAQMGDAARHQQDWNRADELYTEALSHTWWHPIFNNRGWVRCMKGDYEGALADANEAIRMGSKPDDLKHYYHTKATALKGLGRYDEALGAVESSLELDPNFAFSLELKAELEKLR